MFIETAISDRQFTDVDDTGGRGSDVSGYGGGDQAGTDLCESSDEDIGAVAASHKSYLYIYDGK